MPQIRVSDETYRLLKERAKLERRTLSNMVEVLLVPTVDDALGTSVGTPSRTEPWSEALVEELARGHPVPEDNGDTVPFPKEAGIFNGEKIGPGSKPACTCTPAERGKGKHNKWCPAK